MVRLVLLLVSPTALGVRAAEVVEPAEPYRAAVANLERWIESERRAKGIPAMSISLVDRDRVVWARGFGVADPDRRVSATAETVYRVGSVSKLFTDLAAMQLVERGLLDLDAPVTRVLGSFSPRNPFGRPINLRQLMAHRSGLVREPPVGHYFDPSSPSLSDTVESLNRTELIYAPETRTKYSNAGISVVGAMVQALRREPFPRAVEASILRPLGMSRTSFEPSESLRSETAAGQMWSYEGRRVPTPSFLLGTGPAGNMVSSVNDLARFLVFLFEDGRGPDRPIVTPKTLRAMWTPQYVKEGEKGSFGLGFALSELDGHPRVGHGGAVYGFATEVAALTDAKFGVAVVATKDFANGLVQRVAEAALRSMLAVREGKPLPALETTEPVAPDVAKKLAGRYANPRLGVELAARDGKLFLTPREGGPRFELRRRGDDLIVDDVFAFGAKVEPRGEDRLVVRGETLGRIPDERPRPIPARGEGLIGEYGWDHDVLYILEKGGRLHALIEWFLFYPLEELDSDTFRFPDSGLYAGERLVFRRDGAGRALDVKAADVVFRRRSVGGEGGSTFRIKPLRPVAELRTEALAARPPGERGQFRTPELVELARLDPSIRLEIRYATENNFLGTPLYSSARAFLQRPAAEALLRAHRRLEPLGYGLMVHDAYRPWYVTRMFWDATPPPSRIFVANPAAGSKHNRGSAVDLTLYDRRTGLPVAMVGGYDEFSPRSFPDYPGGTDLQRWHRELLRRVMEDEGFRVNEFEWWHFDAKQWDRYSLLNIPIESLPDRPE